MASLGHNELKAKWDSFLYSFMSEHSWAFLDYISKKKMIDKILKIISCIITYQKNNNETNTNASKISSLTEQFEEVRNGKNWINMW